MFEKMLLDSSARRRPALRPVHGLISFLVGVAGFVGATLLIPVAPDPAATRVALIRAAVAGVALFFYALAVCYAWADARREGFNFWLWSVVVLLGNLPGFLIYLVYSALKTGDWKRATVPMAYGVEVFMMGVAALVPLIYTQALPGGVRAIIMQVPTLPRGARLEGTARPQPARSPAPRVNVLVAPSIIPHNIPDFSHQPAPQLDPGPMDGVIGVPPGLGSGQDRTLISILATQPAPPLASSRPAETRRIRVGGIVEAARAISTPPPVYPPLAIATRTQGTVRIHAIIGIDGTVQELTVVSGHPLLIPAARDAVARWRYQPTLLNGEPVEVETEIDVNFVLNN